MNAVTSAEKLEENQLIEQALEEALEEVLGDDNLAGSAILTIDALIKDKLSYLKSLCEEKFKQFLGGELNTIDAERSKILSAFEEQLGNALQKICNKKKITSLVVKVTNFPDAGYLPYSIFCPNGIRTAGIVGDNCRGTSFFSPCGNIAFQANNGKLSGKSVFFPKIKTSTDEALDVQKNKGIRRTTLHVIETSTNEKTLHAVDSNSAEPTPRTATYVTGRNQEIHTEKNFINNNSFTFDGRTGVDMDSFYSAIYTSGKKVETTLEESKVKRTFTQKGFPSMSGGIEEVEEGGVATLTPANKETTPKVAPKVAPKKETTPKVAPKKVTTPTAQNAPVTPSAGKSGKQTQCISPKSIFLTTGSLNTENEDHKEFLRSKKKLETNGSIVGIDGTESSKKALYEMFFTRIETGTIKYTTTSNRHLFSLRKNDNRKTIIGYFKDGGRDFSRDVLAAKTIEDLVTIVNHKVDGANHPIATLLEPCMDNLKQAQQAGKPLWHLKHLLLHEAECVRTQLLQASEIVATQDYLLSRTYPDANSLFSQVFEPYRRIITEESTNNFRESLGGQVEKAISKQAGYIERGEAIPPALQTPSTQHRLPNLSNIPGINKNFQYPSDLVLSKAQYDFLSQFIQSVKSGTTKKPILVAPTGAGKTFVLQMMSSLFSDLKIQFLDLTTSPEEIAKLGSSTASLKGQVIVMDENFYFPKKFFGDDHAKFLGFVKGLQDRGALVVFSGATQSKSVAGIRSDRLEGKISQAEKDLTQTQSAKEKLERATRFLARAEDGKESVCGRLLKGELTSSGGLGDIKLLFGDGTKNNFGAIGSLFCDEKGMIKNPLITIKNTKYSLTDLVGKKGDGQNCIFSASAKNDSLRKEIFAEIYQNLLSPFFHKDGQDSTKFLALQKQLEQIQAEEKKLSDELEVRKSRHDLYSAIAKSDSSVTAAYFDKTKIHSSEKELDLAALPEVTKLSPGQKCNLLFPRKIFNSEDAKNIKSLVTSFDADIAILPFKNDAGLTCWKVAHKASGSIKFETAELSNGVDGLTLTINEQKMDMKQFEKYVGFEPGISKVLDCYGSGIDDLGTIGGDYGQMSMFNGTSEKPYLQITYVSKEDLDKMTSYEMSQCDGRIRGGNPEEKLNNVDRKIVFYGSSTAEPARTNKGELWSKLAENSKKLESEMKSAYLKTKPPEEYGAKHNLATQNSKTTVSDKNPATKTVAGSDHKRPSPIKTQQPFKTQQPSNTTSMTGEPTRKVEKLTGPNRAGKGR